MTRLPHGPGFLPHDRYGIDARDCLEMAMEDGISGARAALETFYYAFNTRSLEVLRRVWLDDPLVQLNNPVGGIVRGIDEIASVYGRIFTSPARVQVGLTDVNETLVGGVAIFAGRERGVLRSPSAALDLSIRTSRLFAYVVGTGWRQVHHHGSIDDPGLLAAYQAALQSGVR
jgi:SnoaL-like domain